MAELSLAALGRQMGETLYEYLERRERELAAQAATVRSDLEAIETELTHVKSARRQIGNIPAFGRTPFRGSTPLVSGLFGLGEDLLKNNPRDYDPVTNALSLSHPPAPPAKSNPPTIKDMILKALWDGFRDTGATQAELRQFIRDAYGRDIDRGSMSPQITRLRLDGLVKQKGGEDNWRLTVRARDQFRADLRYGPEPPEISG